MNMIRSLLALALGAGAVALPLQGRAATAGYSPNGDDEAQSAIPNINPVVQWNRNLLVIVRTAGAQPATIHPTRSFAVMHTAIYDAVNAIDGSHKPYRIRLGPVPGEASENAAAAAAAHEVLVNLYPAFKVTLDLELQQSLAPIPAGERKLEGIRIGQIVADRVLLLRSTDGANGNPVPYVFGTNPGDYQSTPPDFRPQPQFTQWSHVKPFALERANQFRPEPPPALTSSRYSDGFKQIKALGINNSVTATPEEMLIGHFWNGAIQNYWNEIAQTASLAHQLNTEQNARLFALLNISVADSVIAFYDAKYTYNLWRPVTAIRVADTDGNSKTEADPNWLPEGGGKTAPDPSYPGAHATISAAAAEVLASFFHRNHFDFDVTSEVLPGVERSFTSFSAAFEEASFSRVLAGQHFNFDEQAGARLGREVGDFVVDNFLTRRDRDGDHDRDDGHR